MDVKKARFMEALRAALEDRKVEWAAEMSMAEWMELFRMAQAHRVLPMIYETVYACPAARQADPQMLAAFKRTVMQQVYLQMSSTGEFLQLVDHLREAGIEPMVVKGIVCRELYPKPDHRLSGDEDVFVGKAQFSLCDKVFTAFGMHPVENQDDPDAYEVPYGKPGSRLYIELHRTLFPEDSEAYGDMNRFFEHAHERKQQIVIRGTAVTTMAPTDHLFYMICHAYKHFLHSGFGIRQVCDIVLFANHYGSGIDWQRVMDWCQEIRAEYFAASIFEIGRKYLTFDADAACYPQYWREIEIDETAMLEDLLEAGVYGGASMSRKHSSNMTLDAMTASKQGKKVTGGVLQSMFPPARKLESRYHYLKKHPYLLPVAWAARLTQYFRETKRLPGVEAAESIRIGRERIDLMRQYRIIR